jgi:hypothetical protein
VPTFLRGGDSWPLGSYDPLDLNGVHLVSRRYLRLLGEHLCGPLVSNSGLHPKWKAAGRERRIEVADADDVLSDSGQPEAFALEHDRQAHELGSGKARG